MASSEMPGLVIDAHVHIWDPRRVHYPHLGPTVAEIDREFTLDDLAPLRRAAGVDAVILVQSADDDADTDHMLEAADRHPEVVGIVAYLPLHDRDHAERRAAELLADGRVVGVRTLLHNSDDPDRILRPDVAAGLELLEELGLPFDLVAVVPRHLELVVELAERHPALRVVIDHLGRAPVGADTLDPWAAALRRAASVPTATAKVSGLYGRPRLDDWAPQDLRPVIDVALEAFGPDRLLFGGDWPVSVLGGGYARIWEGISTTLGGLKAVDRERILSATARTVYRIPEARLERALAANRKGSR